MRDWIDVAELVKTRNLKGRLVVRATAGLPFVLAEGDEVAFVPPQTDLPRRAQVAFVQALDEATAEVEFAGVGGDEAAGLVGCHCLFRRELLDESVFEQAPATWSGWRVEDVQAGFLGNVLDIVENPGQSLLRVDRADGLGVLLVPAVDGIVREVDADGGIIVVDLPNGLLDL